MDTKNTNRARSRQGRPLAPRLGPLAMAMLACMAGIPSPARAQSDPRPATEPDAAASEPTTLEEVVVTAGKRRQDLRSVAGTVTALQGGELERRGAQDQEDLFKLAPGVQFNKGDPDRALPTIRGIGTVAGAGNLGIQQGTTGMYIEDVPFTDPWGIVSSADLAPFDLERVEVLRGPQGALYGSASLGGAVRYLYNAPDLEAARFSALATVNAVSGGGSGHSLYAMGNLPLSKGEAGLRAVAFDRRDGGYIRNLGTGRDEANVLRQRGGRVIGAARPSEWLSVTGSLMTQKTEIDDSFAVSPDPERLEIDTPTPSTRSSEVTLGNVRIEADLGGHVLTSNTGHYRKTQLQGADFSRLYGRLNELVDPSLPPFPVVRFPFEFSSSSTSQEFRLASADATRFSYVVGAFYQRTRFEMDAVATAPGGAQLWGPLGFLLPDDVVMTEVDRGLAVEKAVFADAEFALGGGWSIGAGGRFYRTSLDIDVDVSFFTDPLLAETHTSESGFTPKASLKYAFGDHHWYALASRGYRYGGVNVNPPVLSTYGSDSLWNYETGVRLQPHRRLRLDLTAFLMDWKDAQVNAVTPGPIPVNGIANVGKARVKGLEALIDWRPTDGLGLIAAVAYTRARTAADFVSNSGALVPSGSRLPGTPEFQSTLQANYGFAGPWETAGLFSLTHSYLSDRVFDMEGRGTASGYGTLDARLAFSRAGWEVALFANNLSDERGIAGVSPQALGTVSFVDYYLVKPRTVGVSLRYDY